MKRRKRAPNKRRARCLSEAPEQQHRRETSVEIDAGALGVETPPNVHVEFQPVCASPGCNPTASDANGNTAGGAGALSNVDETATGGQQHSVWP